MSIWENIREKMRSPVLWTSLAAMVFFVCKEWCGLEIKGWDTFIELLIALLAAFGIVNNPNSRNTL